jgi:hypothetical protein
MQLAVPANRNYDFMTITLSTIDASRRSFLTCLSVLGISGTTLIRAGESGPHSPALVFPTAPHERLAVTSWPFRGYIESPTNPARDRSKPGMDLKQFAAMASEKFGVPNINPLAAHFSFGTSVSGGIPASCRRRAFSRCRSRAEGASLYDPDASKRDAAVASSRKWIDAAVTIGSPSVRQHIQGPKGARPDVELAAKSLGALADYGAKRNIVVTLENDNAVAEDPFFYSECRRTGEQSVSPRAAGFRQFATTSR